MCQIRRKPSERREAYHPVQMPGELYQVFFLMLSSDESLTIDAFVYK
jgi:DNA modification methylase